MMLSTPAYGQVPSPLPRREHSAGSVWGALILAGLLVLGAAASFALPAPSDAPASVEAPASTVEQAGAPSGVVVPAAATDGMLRIVLPPGTAAAIAGGSDGYVLPPVIRLSVGDKVVIRNDDELPHILLFAFVPPGQTVERTFTSPGSETYSAGCSAAMQTSNGFTTIFVSESAG